MPTVDVLYALVPGDGLDALQDHLRLRLTDDEMATRRLPPGTYALCDERLREDLSSARHGGWLGTLGGAAVGLLVAWLTGADTLAMFLLLAGGGAALGALIGGVSAMQRHEVLDDDPAGSVSVDGDGATHLLEIRSERHAFWAHRVLDTHPEVCLLESPEALVTAGARPSSAS